MKYKILKTLVVFIAVAVASSASAVVKDDPLGASMYNELGVKALNNDAIEAAISYLEEAHRLNPGNATVKKNLSIAYFRQGEVEYTKRNVSSAEEYAAAALEHDPNNINALVLMGDIKYFSQKLDEAKALWEKVLVLEPNYKYAGLIEERLLKLKTEQKVARDYRVTGVDQFDIRYSKEGAKLSYDVRYYLQEAYRLLGQDFNLWPKYRLVVLIYNRKDFDSIGGWSKGAIGGYDGKIHLPFIGADFAPDQIRGIIWHEYTHLLVYDVSQGKAPLWMQEGLAYYEGFKYEKSDFSLLKNAVENGQLIAFQDLDSMLSKASDDREYLLACQESCTLATYLMKHYNKYKVREILQLIGEGESFESIIKKRLNITTKELEKRWIDDLIAGKLY